MRLGVHAGPFSVSGRIGGRRGGSGPGVTRSEVMIGSVLMAVAAVVVGMVWLIGAHPWVGWTLLAVIVLVVGVLTYWGLCGVRDMRREERGEAPKPEPDGPRMRAPRHARRAA